MRVQQLHRPRHRHQDGTHQEPGAGPGLDLPETGPDLCDRPGCRRRCAVVQGGQPVGRVVRGHRLRDLRRLLQPVPQAQVGSRHAGGQSVGRHAAGDWLRRSQQHLRHGRADPAGDVQPVADAALLRHRDLPLQRLPGRIDSGAAGEARHPGGQEAHPALHPGVPRGDLDADLQRLRRHELPRRRRGHGHVLAVHGLDRLQGSG
ncbi:hypothetical protein D3C76_1204630 [compost metagenome]